jgi:hypothetical protein
MKNLWVAIGRLAFEDDFRGRIQELAKVVTRNDLQPGLREQPDLQALRSIDQEFRKRNMFLAVYELAEINRWFAGRDQEAFLQALTEYGKTVREVDHAEPGDAEFQAVVGLLVADPEFRDKFAKGVIPEKALTAEPQNEHRMGFAITPEQASALRKNFQPGMDGDHLARRILELGWSGSTGCVARYLPYAGFIHIDT